MLIVIVDVEMLTAESRTAGRESRAADGDTGGAGTSFSFYRAMLSQDVCPSKRLNIYHIISSSSSHAILFFFFITKRYGNILTGPLNGGVKCKAI